MKIRKFGETEFLEVDDSACPFCDAAQMLKWPRSGGIIFLENENGEIRKVTCFGIIRLLRIYSIMCEASSKEEAKVFLSSSYGKR